MYTLTRKLSVVCLTVVLSVLAYGCGGGSSEQATITDVSTDMVTGGLTPDVGTYTIQPGGIANAGDVTFACPADGSSCEVTVADDGTVTSAGGMATAMDSASATARLAALERAMEAEQRAMEAETARMEAEQRATEAETARMEAETARMEAETARMEAETARMEAETARMEAEEMRDAEETARMEAEQRAMEAKVAQMAAEEMRDAKEMARMEAEQRAMEAEAARRVAEAMRNDALDALRIANLRANAESVDISDLLSDYRTIPSGSYDIEPGKNRDVGDANFACPMGGPACEVIVDEDSNVVSAGGMATAQSSMAAMTTSMAKALYEDNTGALETQSEAGGPVIVTDGAADSVTRSPGGVATVDELEHEADTSATNEYTSEMVDTGHEINGWMGLTLKRDDSIAAMMDIEAVSASMMDEVTIYTNIDEAKPGKLKLDETIPTADYRVQVEEDQMFPDDEGDSFEVVLINPTDGTRIPGTFTCDVDDGCTAIGVTETVLGTLVLMDNPGAGWEFESDVNVKEGETSDADYMYFGYWLQSPVDGTTYAFATFSGGNQTFVLDDELTDASHALTATYEGGAAGMYVTRELRVKDGAVDEFSPGFNGGFTAKAALKAYFGIHDDFLEDVPTETPIRQNRVEGSITEFMDGDTELGFEVTLGLTPIAINGSVMGDGSDTGVATATFGKPGDSTGMGTWSAQFYGSSPAGDEDISDAVKNRALPSGVAGAFDVDSTYTKVVGAFAAEKQ